MAAVYQTVAVAQVTLLYGTTPFASARL